ncbi:hypothetical protein OROGR_022765 [Orobanche gracilis]
MALILHPPSYSPSFTTVKPHLLRPKPTKFSVKSQQNSSTEETTSGSKSPNKPGVSSPGSGFGSSSAAPTKKKRPKVQKERPSIIPRELGEKPSFSTPRQAAQSEQLRKNESAFLLAWLGVAAIIILDAVAIAASG